MTQWVDWGSAGSFFCSSCVGSLMGLQSDGWDVQCASALVLCRAGWKPGPSHLTHVVFPRAWLECLHSMAAGSQSKPSKRISPTLQASAFIPLADDPLPKASHMAKPRDIVDSPRGQ